MSNAHREIMKIIPKQSKNWVGDGFNVCPMFGPYAFTSLLSPWLMFDYATPKNFPPTKKRLGVGQHPHRGFETITIAFQGSVEHKDSTGNSGVIGPGDVQWMTAGRGIIHEEFHSTEFAKTGGEFEMCQLWLNLPSEHKMTKPKYQPIVKEDIPSVDITANGEVVGAIRIIAGEVDGVKGPAKTHSPVELWDVSIQNGKVPVEIKIPEDHTLIVFVRRGKIQLLKENKDEASSENNIVGPQSVAIMSQKGNTVCMKALEKNSQVLIMAGESLHDSAALKSIETMGPVAMKREKELIQAMSYY